MSKKETNSVYAIIPRNILPITAVLATKIDIKKRGKNRMIQTAKNNYDAEPLFKRISPI